MNIQLFFYLPLLFLTLYTISQHLLHKILNLPPTPFPILPIFGQIYLLAKPNKPLHRTLSDISKRLGPITFLWFGPRPVLLVSSPNAAQQCLTQNDVVFANRPNLLNGKHFGYNFTSLPWSSYGDLWRKLRRIASVELLCSNKVQNLYEIRANEARSLILKLLRNSNESNGAVDLKLLLFEYAYNVVRRMITGRDDEVESSEEAMEFQEIVTEMSRVTLEANVVDFLPFVRWIWGFRDVERKMILVQEKRDKFMQNVIDEHRRLMEDCVGDDKKKKRFMLEVLLDLQKEEPDCYSDEFIKNLLLFGHLKQVLVQGASHTSSNTLEWALSLLLENPDILERARAEIDDLVGKERLITEADVAEIPYLECIVKETLRMHPAAPLLTPHVSSRKCMVGGYYIPRGTMLLVNAWDIQNNLQTWEDPEKFIPERFGGGKNQDFRYIPFGWGRRACPGENLAMNMVGLALGSLIQCFEWKKVGEIDMSEGKGVITPKVQPLSAICIPRSFVVNLLS